MAKTDERERKKDELSLMWHAFIGRSKAVNHFEPILQGDSQRPLFCFCLIFLVLSFFFFFIIICKMASNTSGDIKLDDLLAKWLQWDPAEWTRQEIEALKQAGDWKQLKERLGTRISFGTAGLRARMQAGFAFMNDLTVLQASQGLLRYVKHYILKNDQFSFFPTHFSFKLSSNRIS